MNISKSDVILESFSVPRITGAEHIRVQVCDKVAADTINDSHSTVSWLASLSIMASFTKKSESYACGDNVLDDRLREFRFKTIEVSSFHYRTFNSCYIFVYIKYEPFD
jgi:hypothetical protein